MNFKNFSFNGFDTIHFSNTRRLEAFGISSSGSKKSPFKNKKINYLFVFLGVFGGCSTPTTTQQSGLQGQTIILVFYSLKIEYNYS